MITFTLTDSTDSQTYTLYDVPFTDSEEGGEETITTLDGNVYVDFIYTKNTWEREFSFMKESDYLSLKGFQEDRKTVDACGNVEDVKITMRETTQQ